MCRIVFKWQRYVSLSAVLSCHLSALAADNVLLCVKVPQKPLMKPISSNIDFETILELARVVKIRHSDDTVLRQWPGWLLTNVEDLCFLVGDIILAKNWYLNKLSCLSQEEA